MIKLSFSDRELLARIIKCEAGGEGDSGMRGVATVIMNRVNSASGEYARVSQGGSIRDIIFQPGQFNCATDVLRGKYNPQNIYNIQPESIHYDIADWAIGGNRLNAVGNCLWFMNPYSEKCPSEFPYNGTGVNHTRINKHCFYRPTSLYNNT